MGCRDCAAHFLFKIQRFERGKKEEICYNLYRFSFYLEEVLVNPCDPEKPPRGD
jgi:hypothetical protein